jgi:hypothetical protein
MIICIKKNSFGNDKYFLVTPTETGFKYGWAEDKEDATKFANEEVLGKMLKRSGMNGVSGLKIEEI